MHLQLEVFDTNGRFRGYAEMNMDWNTKNWQIVDDKALVWNRVGFSKGGSFELKPWGVIWIWDRSRNTVIFWDAPTGETDNLHRSGEARIFDPQDHSLKDGKIRWKIDLTKNVAASPGSNAASTPLRAKLLKVLREVLPCSYMDKNYVRITGGLKKQGGGYTTCGSLPGFVTSELGAGDPTKPQWMTYMNTYSLNGTNIVRTKGIKYNAWEWGGKGKRPKPGDIYVLLDHGKTNRETDGVSHVGVIIDSTGDIWKTADLGQGDGYQGKIDVIRPYKAASDELFGETNQGGGYRTLAGWVDIDRYFAKR
jgi:hypothetical protein